MVTYGCYAESKISNFEKCREIGTQNGSELIPKFSEVKQVEKRDAVLTKEQQIERLTKPGSKYGNLNPFAVLMVSYDSDENTIRKSFRKLSILTHPDKNPDQKVSDSLRSLFSKILCKNFHQKSGKREISCFRKVLVKI